MRVKTWASADECSFSKQLHVRSVGNRLIFADLVDLHSPLVVMTKRWRHITYGSRQHIKSLPNHSHHNSFIHSFKLYKIADKTLLSNVNRKNKR